MIYPRFIGSSVDPEKLSLTLQSFVPLVIAVAALFGVKLLSVDLQTLITAVIAVVSAVGTIYGLYRKVVSYFQNR